ncbi:MAG: DJ-1/PfpI family protein, partial [Bdellovibrio sp.]
QISNQEFDAVFLPGGHDKGMREYLESKFLQKTVAQFFEENKPVAAICHGVLLVARSISAKTGKSVLYNRKTTGLTSLQELTAFNLTRAYLGDYYLTYPEVTLEDEVKSFLKNKSDFIRGPGYPIPLLRDSEKNQKCGFALQDGNYLSSRWPGDAHHFSVKLLNLLKNI